METPAHLCVSPYSIWSWLSPPAIYGHIWRSLPIYMSLHIWSLLSSPDLHIWRSRHWSHQTLDSHTWRWLEYHLWRHYWCMFLVLFHVCVPFLSLFSSVLLLVICSISLYFIVCAISICPVNLSNTVTTVCVLYLCISDSTRFSPQNIPSGPVPYYANFSTCKRLSWFNLFIIF